MEVVGEAEQQEILQGTEQEAAKVQQEQETTSDNKQEEETGGRGSHKAGCCFGRGSLYKSYKQATLYYQERYQLRVQEGKRGYRTQTD